MRIQLGFRLTASLCVCGWLASSGAPQPASPKCSLSGTVRDVITGAPLNKVAVSLSVGFAPHGEACTSNDHYSVITDSNGNFVFSDLNPGCYSVKAERSSYAPLLVGSHDPNLAGSSTPIRAGESLTGVATRGRRTRRGRRAGSSRTIRLDS